MEFTLTIMGNPYTFPSKSKAEIFYKNLLPWVRLNVGGDFKEKFFWERDATRLDECQKRELEKAMKWLNENSWVPGFCNLYDELSQELFALDSPDKQSESWLRRTMILI